MNVPFPGCVYCVKKTFFEICHQYWVETCPHDALLWRSSELSESAYVLNEPLILWRKHETSAWQQEIKNQSVESELKWRKVEAIELEELLRFLKKEFPEKEDTSAVIVKRNLEWCRLRTRWFTEKKLTIGIGLTKYLDLYYSYKGFLKDLYLVLIGK